jgi:hypothetical protein
MPPCFVFSRRRGLLAILFKLPRYPNLTLWMTVSARRQGMLEREDSRGFVVKSVPNHLALSGGDVGFPEEEEAPVNLGCGIIEMRLIPG